MVDYTKKIFKFQSNATKQVPIHQLSFYH